MPTFDHIVLATENRGKVAELSDLLARTMATSVRISPQSDFNIVEAEETGTTFVENAIIKARNASQQTGLPAIADDSGIEVQTLNGQPGIYSARYAGDKGDTANNEKLLSSLLDCDNRQARFFCALVFMRHAADPVPIICEGSWHGEIARTSKGKNGFGYDPIFLCAQTGKHAAELSASEKSALSHRGEALTILVEELKAYDIVT